MIAKFTDGVLNTLGNGELTQIHIDLGYSQIDEALIATDTDGKYFKYYLTTPDADGIYQADTVKIATETQTALIAHFTGLVDAQINTAIEDYNKTNFTAFKTAEGVEKFNKVDSAHYAFALSMSDWIISSDPWVSIWAKARDIQVDALNGVKHVDAWADVVPTDPEFISALPARV